MAGEGNAGNGWEARQYKAREGVGDSRKYKRGVNKTKERQAR